MDTRNRIFGIFLSALLSFIIFLLVTVFIVDTIDDMLERDLESLALNQFTALFLIVMLYQIGFFASFTAGDILTLKDVEERPKVIKANIAALLLSFVWLGGMGILKVITYFSAFEITPMAILASPALFMAYGLGDFWLYWAILAMTYIAFREIIITVNNLG